MPVLEWKCKSLIVLPIGRGICLEGVEGRPEGKPDDPDLDVLIESMLGRDIGAGCTLTEVTVCIECKNVSS